MTNSFWKNKKVLITGYEGFLGSWLTKILLSYGADIIGLDIETYRKKTILSQDELSRVRIIKGSVNNFFLVSRTIKKNNVEIIFHLAARALVNYCLHNPLKAFSTNIGGTWNVLEACRNVKSIKGIVIASSDKAYGSHKTLPYREDFPLLGIHPYDVSKSCADLLSNAYFNTYGLPVCVTRCGNIFGPGDFNFSRLIPETIKSIIKKKELIIRSDGKFVRDYIFVKDIVDGYLILAKKMYESKILGESFNFSNESPFLVLDIVKVIYKLMDKKYNYKILNQAKHEIKKQFLLSKKAKILLKWRPKYSLERALRETIDWYSAYLGR